MYTYIYICIYISIYTRGRPKFFTARNIVKSKLRSHFCSAILMTN